MAQMLRWWALPALLLGCVESEALLQPQPQPTPRTPRSPPTPQPQPQPQPPVVDAPGLWLIPHHEDHPWALFFATPQARTLMAELPSPSSTPHDLHRVEGGGALATFRRAPPAYAASDEHLLVRPDGGQRTEHLSLGAYSVPSPNGAWVMQWSPDKMRLQNVLTGERTPVPLRPDDVELAKTLWSPASNRALLQGHTGRMWIVDLDGQVLEVTPATASIKLISWSPGGRTLLVAGASLRLITEGEVRVLPQPQGVVRRALWSPDDRGLMVESTLQDNHLMYLFAHEDGEWTRVRASSSRGPFAADFDPQGGQLAIFSKHNNSIWLYGLDGARSPICCASFQRGGAQPGLRWSPSGEHLLAWGDGALLTDRTRVLWEVDIGSVQSGHWSPSGPWSAVVTEEAVHLLALPYSPQQLSLAPGGLSKLTWSSDGRWLVVLSGEELLAHRPEDQLTMQYEADWRWVDFELGDP